MIGQKLSHYCITAKLGEGGMGVVWRATDERLDREVALKLLPDDFAQDSERHARFEREAKLLASLNHPNVAILFGLEHLDGQHGLVMELVEGEGLDEVIARGPIPLPDAVAIALQIAEAIEAAHEAGIVHRDLKPANVRVRPDGVVKVLDFGLAKAWEEKPGDSDLSLSPTITQHATAAGVILGTAAYMSPEQARGKPVDRRTDIWAFGALLWEMLTGRSLFAGESVTDILASVLKEEPRFDVLPPETPSSVRRLLTRCLTREPHDRLQWIGDARLELAEAQNPVTEEGTTAARHSSSPSRGRELLAWSAAVVGFALVLVLWWSHNEAGERPLIRFSVSVGDEQTLFFADQPLVDVSPDGKILAFIATSTEVRKSMIYLRRLSESWVWPLGGTEGAAQPVFSPQGNQIAFFADGMLKHIPVDGGTATTLAESPNPRGVAWLSDETLLYSPSYADGLWTVSASGGAPELLIELNSEAGERTFRFPDVLHGDRVILFTIGMTDSPNNYDNAKIAAYSLDTGLRHIVIENANMARFVSEDRLVYSRAGVLYTLGFDLENLESRGEPLPVIEDVGGDPTSGAGYFAVAADGTCAWVNGAIAETDALLTIVERAGPPTILPLGPRGFHQPRFSPDGSKLAVTVGAGHLGVEGEVWVYSFATEAFNRVTFDQNELYPLWTPDGHSMAHLSYLTKAQILLRPVDGSGGTVQLVTDESAPLFPESFSPDGKTLAYTRIAQTTDVYLVTEGGEPRLYQANASSPVFSPDGRWIAYASPASGNAAVYVRSVKGEGKWQVSPGLGAYPRWPSGGNRIFYIELDSPQRSLMEVSVESAGTFSAGPPRVVVQNLNDRFVTATAPETNWDAAPAGDRFAFVEFKRDENAGAQIEVAVNWAAHLK